MTLGLRGIVWEGEVVAWPTILMDHNAAFATWPPLAEYTCRWRQWDNEAGAKVDFDPGCSDEDKTKVLDYIEKVQGIRPPTK